jgi:acetoin:2,6-dichlorophenolindophenol oxidoreductase subunit alpha
VTSVSAQPADEVDVTPDEAPEAEYYLGLYERMLLIRRFEDAVHGLFVKNVVHGTTHLCSGQEASPVGVCSMLQPGDKVSATYRGHGQALALGLDPQKLMDELLGRATGICGGRAGSMNVIDIEHGLVGCFAIVGGSIAAATGAGLAAQVQEGSNVAVAFFGDGATNQAYFHECLNLASIRRLPMVFVCENNLYQEYTPLEKTTAGDISARPRAYGLPTEVVDGNDLWAVRAAADQALSHARSGAGPAFIEALTYRLVGHSRSDPATYRKPGELETWRKRDPLLIARDTLTQRYALAPHVLDDVDRDTQTRIDTVVERALAAPWPDPNTPPREFKP